MQVDTDILVCLSSIFSMQFKCSLDWKLNATSIQLQLLIAIILDDRFENNTLEFVYITLRLFDIEVSLPLSASLILCLFLLVNSYVVTLRRHNNLFLEYIFC